MTIPRLFAFAAAIAILFLLPAGAVATNAVLPFSGTLPIGADGSASCGAPFDFQVGTGTKTIDVAATTDVPANDIVAKLYRKSDGMLLGSSDTATSPEAVHYSPGNDIPEGTYQAWSARSRRRSPCRTTRTTTAP